MLIKGSPSAGYFGQRLSDATFQTTPAMLASLPLSQLWRDAPLRMGAAALLLALGLQQAVVRSDLDDRLYAAWMRASVPAQEAGRGIGLFGYQAEIQGKALAGVADNASGLAWSGDTGTLFLAINNPEQIIELSPRGEVLRRIELSGFSDVESLDWVGGSRFVLAEERRQALVLVDLNETQTRIARDQARSFSLGIEAGNNKGFEGIAWDPRDNGLYIARERDPMRLYKLLGLLDGGPNAQISLVADLPEEAGALAHNSDLSGLHFDPVSNSLLVLSDESRLLSEVRPNGRAVSFLELSRGWHGLEKDVPQAEGVAMDEEGTLYLVSEPNLFYVFKRSAGERR